MAEVRGKFYHCFSSLFHIRLYHVFLEKSCSAASILVALRSSPREISIYLLVSVLQIRVQTYQCRHLIFCSHGLARVVTCIFSFVLTDKLDLKQSVLALHASIIHKLQFTTVYLNNTSAASTLHWELSVHKSLCK